jgi:hypothetical protein
MGDAHEAAGCAGGWIPCLSASPAGSASNQVVGTAVSSGRQQQEQEHRAHAKRPGARRAPRLHGLLQGHACFDTPCRMCMCSHGARPSILPAERMLHISYARLMHHFTVWQQLCCTQVPPACPGPSHPHTRPGGQHTCGLQSSQALFQRRCISRAQRRQRHQSCAGVLQPAVHQSVTGKLIWLYMGCQEGSLWVCGSS